uniref:WD_REPEATS_REGION domain-containing protein n=1 Tax=Macrostomum lignano TaxID=282301 RepID=A0A1I8HQC5_9PLAT
EKLEESREATEEPPEAGCDSEAEYEELEPRLKYHRVGQGNTDLPRILDKDFITSLAVHSKFICVGTNWGNIYILDHMGNNIQGSQSDLRDEKGEYLASCSMDERVIIHNLFNKKTYSTLKLDKPVYAVAISPNFAATQSYVTGDDRLILVEPGFIKKQHRVLAEARPNCGAIRCIVWANSLVVWGTEEGVRAYCLVERRSLTSLPAGRPPRPTGQPLSF